MSVERFRGDNYFLSNMYVMTNWIETDLGIAVTTSEHAYQAARFVDPETHKIVAGVVDGITAKDLAHELIEAGEPQLPDWETTKVWRMHGIVHQKFFRNPELARLLIATGNENLVEGNTWDDTFWGVCPVGSNNGFNILGNVLMIVRAELQTPEAI